MKILYVTEIFPDEERGIGVWGGGEKRIYEISRRISRYGNEVTVFTCRFPGQPSYDNVDGVDVYRFGLTRDPVTGGARRVIFPIVSYIIRTGVKICGFHPDIIHCNTYFPVFSGSMAKLFKDIPTVVTFHDLYGLKGWIHSQKSILWGFLGHLVTYFSTKCMYDKIIAVSPQCKQKLLSVGVPHEKIMVIPNGVDIKLFDSTEVVKVPNQILYVGRLVNFKHVDWLIKAFYKVLKYLPDAQLKIVGWGPEWYSLKKLVRSLGLEKHIIFTGRTPTYEDVVRYYKESEVFVLPSTVEGEAIVLKEAMAARLPVIAIDVKGSGVLSIVRDGHNGFLVKPGDIDSIAKRIINLLENKELAREIGDRGRRFVEKYDWNRVAEMVYIVYREVYEKEKS